MAPSDHSNGTFRIPTVPVTFKAFQMMTGVGIGCGVGIGIGRAMEFRSLPIVGPALGGSGELSRTFESIRGPVRRAILRFGLRRLDAGIGCGVGIGHGFGVGLALKPGVATRIGDVIKNTASKWLARFELRMSIPQADATSPTSFGPELLPHTPPKTSEAEVSRPQLSSSAKIKHKLTAKDFLDSEIADADILKLVLIKLLQQEAVNEALKQILIDDVEPDVAFHRQGIDLPSASTIDTRSSRRKCFNCRRKGRLK